jgi:hypothetical protein
VIEATWEKGRREEEGGRKREGERVPAPKRERGGGKGKIQGVRGGWSESGRGCKKRLREEIVKLAETSSYFFFRPLYFR